MTSFNLKNLIKLLYAIVIFLCFLIIFYLKNTENDQVSTLSLKLSFNKIEKSLHHANYAASQSHLLPKFDLNRHLLVFVHIQKCGGSDFDRSIVKHLLVQASSDNSWRRACKNTSLSESFDKFQERKVKFKKYECNRDYSTMHGERLTQVESKNWYFSRQTFGWACGLHADLSQLTECVPSRFYPSLNPQRDVKYFTILREPNKRFISEWLHVRRGATWIRKPLSLEQECLNDYYKLCFSDRANWANVTLRQFVACKWNLAINRQTRMLARFDANFKMCDYLQSQTQVNQDELFKRAKKSLDEGLSYFAINEFQYLSKLLFEKTFRHVFRFENEFSQTNASLTESIWRDLDSDLVREIERLNYLDMRLYKHAVNLFFRRLEFYKIFY